jgi:hypothetical protein
MLAALLMGILFFSGGGFTAKIFGKDTQAVVREVVSDPARAEVAMQTLKHGNKDLKPITKQLDKIARDFSKADEAQSAGLDVLTPFLQQASEQRRIAQSKSLDRVFELRKTLTEEEWNAIFAKLE